jgi:membrane-associated protease RseP (regulator of RpoE activity)
MFLTLTILPHELGHAGMARWLGMRVFKIYVGSGKTMFSVRLLGFEVEFRAVPMGGLVLATHRGLEWLRVKQFAFILAGPAVNFVLVAMILPFLDSEQLWSFRPMEQGLQFGLVFLYANLAVLVENLWPHDVATGFGSFPSDGKQLFLTFFLSREKKELHHAANFVMEASVCHQQGDYEGARKWVLELYPGNEALLSWYGVIALELAEYGKARSCFLKLLHRESKQPLMRPLMLNNIAYTNALLGGDDLLKEADALSQEAMTAMSWMPAIRGTRGTVLVAIGQFEEALPLLHDSMSQSEIANHKAQNACMIAEAECRRGNLDVARAYLEEGRKLDPKCSLLSRAETILRETTIPKA